MVFKTVIKLCIFQLAGLLEENEKFIMESFNSKFTKYSKHWMPIVWASSIITRARKEGILIAP